MISQVLIISVVFGDAIRSGAFVDIPADKVHGIVEVVAVGTSITGRGDVNIPSAVQCLAVTVSGRGSRAGDKAEIPCAWRLGVGLKRRFLMDDCQQHR